MARKIPFSVDITGSFVYSEPLVEARKLYHDGVWSSAKLHEIEDKEIYRIVEKCKEIGLKCVTDGDYKSTNYLDFFHHLENITKQEPAQPEEVKESVISGKIGFDNAYPSTPKVTQRFTYLTGIIGGDMYAKVLLRCWPSCSAPRTATIPGATTPIWICSCTTSPKLTRRSSTSFTTWGADSCN